MFCNTMIPPDTRLQQRAYESPKPNAGKTRHCTEPDPHKLLGLTATSVAGASLNRTVETVPALKDQLRHQTNEKIHDYNRDARDSVVAMRHVERSASLETISLSRHRKSVISCIEKASRSLWLGHKTQQLRSLRPKCCPDVAVGAVGEESQNALTIKRSLEQHLTHVDNVFRMLKSARENLLFAVKACEKPLELAPASCSFTKPNRAPQTAEISAAQEFQHESARLRLVGAALIRTCEQGMDDMKKRSHQAMEESITQATKFHGDLVVSHSEARMASNTARRSLHITSIRSDVDDGPREMRYAAARQRIDRPLVRAHHTGPGISTGAVTAVEAAPTARRVFGRSLSAASVDAAILDELSANLSAAYVDAADDVAIDRHVLRLRRRCDPSRRV